MEKPNIDPTTLTVISFCDPAGSKKNRELKKIRARHAIVTIGVEPELNRIFVLDTWAATGTTDLLIDKIIATNNKWQPKTFGIEDNAMQSLFADALRREMRFKNIRIPLVNHSQPLKIDKDDRIRDALQPVMREGRLFLDRKQYELIAEMRSFPTGKTKDLVDALASAIAFVPKKAVKSARQQSHQALVDYLRDSGAPIWYIEEQMRNGGRY